MSPAGGNDEGAGMDGEQMLVTEELEEIGVGADGLGPCLGGPEAAVAFIDGGV